MARKVVIAVVAILLAAGTGFALIWAPFVPFERLVTMTAPKTPDLCPGTEVCEIGSFNVWARSYGSLAYDFLGYGPAPFGGPVTVQRNGVVMVMTFNGSTPSDPTNYVEYPASTPEPFPLLRVNGLTVYPHGAPFGGTMTQISVTNLGTGEIANVYWSGVADGNQWVPAGATVLLNSTDWTGAPLPAANSEYTVAFFSSIHYPKLWLNALTTQSVLVTYAP